jgi:hypothetical protein
LAAYGVIVRLAEGAVDAAATAELRARLAAGRLDSSDQIYDLAASTRFEAPAP